MANVAATARIAASAPSAVDASDRVATTTAETSTSERRVGRERSPATGSTGEDRSRRRRAAARDEPFRRFAPSAPTPPTTSAAAGADGSNDDDASSRDARTNARVRTDPRDARISRRARRATGTRGKTANVSGFSKSSAKVSASRAASRTAREFVGGKVRGGGRANDDDVRSERRDGFVFFPRAIEPADDHESSPGGETARASPGRPAQIARRGRGASESSDADVNPRDAARESTRSSRDTSAFERRTCRRTNPNRGGANRNLRPVSTSRPTRVPQRRRERRREVRRERRRESRGVFGGGDGRGRDATRLSHHHGGVQRTETEPDDAIPDGVNASRLRDDGRRTRRRSVFARARLFATARRRGGRRSRRRRRRRRERRRRRVGRRAPSIDAPLARSRRGMIAGNVSVAPTLGRRAESTPSGGEYFGRGAFGGGAFGRWFRRRRLSPLAERDSPWMPSPWMPSPSMPPPRPRPSRTRLRRNFLRDRSRHRCVTPRRARTRPRRGARRARRRATAPDRTTLRRHRERRRRGGRCDVRRARDGGGDVARRPRRK